MPKFKLTTILKMLLLIFGLNFIWEISHMSLYAPHSFGFWNFIFVHLKASGGDVIIFGLIYILGLAFFKSPIWFLQKSLATYVWALFCGLTIAILIEKYALATGRWAYNDFMPIVPFFEVGLTPLLQMLILPTIFLKITQKNNLNS